MSELNHPYTPKHLNLPQYKENTITDQSIFNILLSFIGILSLFSHYRISNANFEATNFQILTYTWLILVGWKGLLLDTYYFLFYNELEFDNSLFSQIWKEIGKFNSILLLKDKGIILNKFIFGVIVSILSLLTSELIYQNSIKQYPLLLLISTIFSYSNFIEFTPKLLDKLPYTNQDLYYTMIFIAYNSFSIIFPLILVWDSVENLNELLDLLI